MSSPITSHKTNAAYMARFMALEQPADKIQVTYVYLNPGNDNQAHYCGKTRVFDFVPKSPDQLPLWDSGVMTDVGKEMLLRPVRIYRDPFRGGDNRLVLCETLDADDQNPLPISNRQSCLDAMEKARDHKPWFGIEQEYMLMDGHNKAWPLGWPKNGYPEPISTPSALYHCAVGANVQFGRDVMEVHFRVCLYAGVNISGENAEGQPGQWEYQVGPCEGIQLGDDLIMSRYLLYRVAEDLHVGVTFDPKPVPEWLGNGLHTNFSTAAMRAPGGLDVIKRAMEPMAKNHEKHMRAYDPRGGQDNLRRLTGQLWSSDITKFSWGIANRGASVRIPKRVALNGCGYFEDRRPASNADPYLITEHLVRTCCLNE